MVAYTKRPTAISGCWQTWQEQDGSQIVRTEMESGYIKVRRRFTGLTRTAQVTATYPAELYDLFMDWFRVYSQTGVQPTNIVEPTGVESVWRFASPPVIEWIDRNAFRASCVFEKMPGWQDL